MNGYVVELTDHVTNFGVSVGVLCPDHSNTLIGLVMDEFPDGSVSILRGEVDAPCDECRQPGGPIRTAIALLGQRSARHEGVEWVAT